MITFIFWLSIFAYADDKPVYCDPQASVKVEKRFPVPSNVNYFIRSAPGSQSVAFPSNDGNFILDLNSGKLEKVPGFIDPVLTPDGEVLTVPAQVLHVPKESRIKVISTDDSAMDMKYYLRGDLVLQRPSFNIAQNGRAPVVWNPIDIPADQVRRGQDPYAADEMTFLRKSQTGQYEPIFTDGEITENYQSVGIISQSVDRPSYRMLYARTDGIHFRDFTFTKASHKLRPAGPIAPICPGLSLNASLPMLSKRGDEFSVYLPDDEVTRTYAINRANGTCTQKDQIPLLAGKVDFSPSGKHLAFHVDQASLENGIFTNPGPNNRLAVFVFDRTKQKMMPIAGNESEDAYYPVFMDDDTLAFVSATKGDGRKFFINLAKINFPVTVACQGCSEANRKGQMAALLGRLANVHCGNGDDSFHSSLVTFSRLTTAQCNDLVDSVTDNELKSFLEFNPMSDKKLWRVDKVKDVDISSFRELCGPPGSEAPDAAAGTVK